jgi:hypothetical protein
MSSEMSARWARSMVGRPREKWVNIIIRLAMRTSARAELTPLTPERYKIQFTVSRQTRDKLRRAQDLLRHAVPTGDPAIIFDRALTLLLTQLERSKTGATDRPRHHATCPRRRSGSSGSATADAAPSSGRTGDVRRRRFLNITMSCRLPQAVRRRLRTSSCDAGRTISTKADQYFGPLQVPMVREEPVEYRVAAKLVPERGGL